MAANQNQGQARFSVTSSLVSMFDENSNQLRIAGYDTGLQIGIWVPSVSPEGKMTFPQENRHTIILSQEAVATLDCLLKNEVIEKVASHQPFKKGIPANRSATNMLDLIVTDTGDVYLRMNRDLNADKVAKETWLYKFAKDAITTNYNPQTGEFDVEMIDAQFALFCNTISAYTGMSQVAGHGAHNVLNYEMNRMYRYLQGIAAKLGVSITTEYGNGGQSSIRTTQDQGYNGAVNEASDISGLLM